VIEEVRVLYYKHLKMDVRKPESGDSDGETEDVSQTFHMDDFHPHEIYIFADWGSTVIVGRGHVNFLKNTQDM
jgi:hypothetical protein